MKPSQLIAGPERERIESAVTEAERGTAGEIVVKVVRAAAPHAASPWRLSLLLAGLFPLGAAFFEPDLRLIEILGLQALATGLAHLLCRLDPIRRAFTSDLELRTSAEQAALDALMQHVIRRTENRTGILIFVSLLEHRVVVLGDEAVDQALDPSESWQEVVDLVLEGIRAGEATEGIVRAIGKCGEILSHPLPIQPDDVNEIERGLILSD
ncbi:MAG: TPM domain-containing protein [Myxococcota bacterium]